MVGPRGGWAVGRAARGRASEAPGAGRNKMYQRSNPPAAGIDGAKPFPNHRMEACDLIDGFEEMAWCEFGNEGWGG